MYLFQGILREQAAGGYARPEETSPLVVMIIGKKGHGYGTVMW